MLQIPSQNCYCRITDGDTPACFWISFHSSYLNLFEGVLYVRFQGPHLGRNKQRCAKKGAIDLRVLRCLRQMFKEWIGGGGGVGGGGH